MAIFLVLSLKESNAAVDSAVSKNFSSPDAYQIEPGKWVVNAEAATAKQLSIKLGLRESASHLILPVRGYTGRAQPDLWEWLSAQAAKADA